MCFKKGATVSCNQKIGLTKIGCPNNFHFTCAISRGCMFFKDKVSLSQLVCLIVKSESATFYLFLLLLLLLFLLLLLLLWLLLVVVVVVVVVVVWVVFLANIFRIETSLKKDYLREPYVASLASLRIFLCLSKLFVWRDVILRFCLGQSRKRSEMS